ncbi:MAG: GntR family transcriptional regulator [Pseudomonadota bacterium]
MPHHSASQSAASSSPKQTCLDDLRQRILAMDIAPGADLDETALSAHYGVSRTPLREVLQRLGGEGYVTLSENRGAKVASMDLAQMRSFFQTAPMVYASTARLAAENRSPGQIAILKEVQSSFATAVASTDAAEMALHNHRFHAEIGEMAGNAYLSPSLRRLLIDHTRLGQMFYRAEDETDRTAIATASAQHDQMIDAIEGQDPARAVTITLAHWDLSRDRIERFVRPAPLPLDPTEPQEAANAL